MFLIAGEGMPTPFSPGEMKVIQRASVEMKDVTICMKSLKELSLNK